MRDLSYNSWPPLALSHRGRVPLGAAGLTHKASLNSSGRNAARARRPFTPHPRPSACPADSPGHNPEQKPGFYGFRDLPQYFVTTSHSPARALLLNISCSVQGGKAGPQLSWPTDRLRRGHSDSYSLCNLVSSHCAAMFPLVSFILMCWREGDRTRHLGHLWPSPGCSASSLVPVHQSHCFRVGYLFHTA